MSTIKCISTFVECLLNFDLFAYAKTFGLLAFIDRWIIKIARTKIYGQLKQNLFFKIDLLLSNKNIETQKGVSFHFTYPFKDTS